MHPFVNILILINEIRDDVLDLSSRHLHQMKTSKNQIDVLVNHLLGIFADLNRILDIYSFGCCLLHFLE